MTSPCSCPCPLNLSMTPTRAAGLAVGTGATVAWYALPDVVRSRPLRGLMKVGLLGAMGWSLVSLMPEGDELPRTTMRRIARRKRPRIRSMASRRRSRASWLSWRARYWGRRS